MRTVLTATASAAVLLLAACTGTPPQGQASGSTTFTYANNLEVMTGWDPATAYSNEVIAMNNIYEQLTRYDSASRTVKPLLADSWTSSRDGLTWTFTLHPGVTFSTGRPADARAAKTAIERTIKLAGGASYEWDPVKTVTAPNATTLELQLKYAAPMDLIASSAYGAFIYDTAAAAPADLAAWFEAGHTAGTGPYVVEDYHKGQENELALKANPTYWRGWQGEHYEQLRFRVVPQETTAAQLLQSGQVSFVGRLSPPLFQSLKSTTGVHTSTQPSFENMIAMFNTASGPLADVRVRRAVAKAIDYEGIVTALKGSVAPAQGVVPEGLLGHSPEVRQVTDPAGAKELLQQAGYGPGTRPLSLDLTYASGTPELATTVSLIKSDLAKVGITLRARGLAWETQWALGKSADRAKRQDIFLFYWYPDYADPFSWFVNLYRSAPAVSFNLAYWKDPAADAAIDRLQALTATDRDKVQEEYLRLQKTLLDQAVSPVLGVETYHRAYSSSVGGYVDNPSYANVVFVHDLVPQS
ncbi:ABC transporter substrate-binding protein [Phycicoccus sp. Soil803]|uniref:ABC transporter substrate-binding protein n=1 Tax=Phycicoccus sp. Soil803 TaxID=1736415 RepID=UPI00070BCF28|nr:ABC transporter substrate-binding protein [Phycicoccus sp. Soil803]KRF24998.1 ABC transporter substrate-binding protein [Phycicoccus sp. Soil803]